MFSGENKFFGTWVLVLQHVGVLYNAISLLNLYMFVLINVINLFYQKKSTEQHVELEQFGVATCWAFWLCLIGWEDGGGLLLCLLPSNYICSTLKQKHLHHPHERSIFFWPGDMWRITLASTSSSFQWHVWKGTSLSAQFSEVQKDHYFPHRQSKMTHG